MQVQSINNQYSPNFGIKISSETIERANQACIERVRLARSQGLTLAEYNELHREDYIHTIGNKTYDFYAIAEEIVSDREKLNKVFGDAWNKVVKSHKSVATKQEGWVKLNN